MYELVRAAGDSFYIDCPSKIGVVELGGGEACLIDSGNNRDAGRRALRILEGRGLKLTAVYNTHSHADHTGGNAFLQSRTGCKIYAPDAECAFARHPILEPAFLYGGFPFRELRSKFLLAEESDAEYLAEGCLPAGFEMIDLPGHFFAMKGFRTPDGAVFLSDCLSSEETLGKYGISFIYDVEAYLATLAAVKGMNAKVFIPSHAPAAEDISGLAELNIRKVTEIAGRIEKICAQPSSFETVLKGLFEELGFKMTFEQYVLTGSTVRSYLAWLKDKGRIEAFFDKNLLLWKRI